MLKSKRIVTIFFIVLHSHGYIMSTPLSGTLELLYKRRELMECSLLMLSSHKAAVPAAESYPVRHNAA